MVFLTTLPIARSAQLSIFDEYLFGRDLEGSGVVCLVVLDWCVLDELRKPLKIVVTTGGVQEEIQTADFRIRNMNAADAAVL